MTPSHTFLPQLDKPLRAATLQAGLPPRAAVTPGTAQATAPRAGGVLELFLVILHS